VTLPSDGSLRRRLLLRLWIPLSALLLVAAVLSFAVAFHFGSVVFDRWLLDSAMTLASQVQARETGLQLSLPQSALEMFEWDAVDHIYSEVTIDGKGPLFGKAAFPPVPASVSRAQPYFSDGVIDDRQVRIVAVFAVNPRKPSEGAVIQVAETKHKRTALVWDILSLLVPLQVGIVIVAGTLIWYAVRSSLRSLDGIARRLRSYEPTHLVPLEDVNTAPSEIKPLLIAINKLIDGMAQAQSAQQRFVANASHQLRTPLAALQVQTERALREKDPDKHSEALSRVYKGVTRMRHLTQQLLTLTRSDASSAGMLRMHTIDLAALVREHLEEWLDRAIAMQIDLGYEGPESGVMITGEPQLLTALLGNLVDNALTYNKPGGTVTVSVRAHPVCVSVQDDGPGIPAHELQRIFEPFYRREHAGSRGCGLGLPIARELAARHGATLRITRNPGDSGTRVDVWFGGSGAQLQEGELASTKVVPPGEPQKA